MMSFSLGSEPARVVALRANEKRYLSASPCKQGHFWRYTAGSMGCAECSDVRRKGMSSGKGAAVIDHDGHSPRREKQQLARRSFKFLQALYAEKLTSIRTASSEI